MGEYATIPVGTLLREGRGLGLGFISPRLHARRSSLERVAAPRGTAALAPRHAGDGNPRQDFAFSDEPFRRSLVAGGRVVGGPTFS